MERRTRRSTGMVAALILAVGALGIGIASGQTSGDTYTGCLRSNGKLVKVAVGNAPLEPCVEPAVQVSWGEIGPRGVRGPQGPQGEEGAPGSGVCSTGSPMSLSGGTADTVVPDANNVFSSLIQQVPATTTNTNGAATVWCFGTLSNFSVTASGNPDGTLSQDRYVFFMRLNQQTTSVQCSIHEGTGAPWSCTDDVGDTSIDVVPGDVVNVRVFEADGDPVPLHFDWSATFTYPMPTAAIS